MDTFRQASEPQTIETSDHIRKGGADIIENTNVETPLSQYEAVHQIPYTAKFFEVDDYRRLDDINDSSDTRLNVKTIEEYVYKKIVDNDLYDTQDVYDDIINELFEKIGLDKNERLDSKLSKTAKYIELLSRSKTTAQRREIMIKKQMEIENRLNGFKEKLFKINENIKDLHI